MDEDFNYEGAEGSDIDAWEAEQVFQDHEGQDDGDQQMRATQPEKTNTNLCNDAATQTGMYDRDCG